MTNLQYLNCTGIPFKKHNYVSEFCLIVKMKGFSFSLIKDNMYCKKKPLVLTFLTIFSHRNEQPIKILSVQFSCGLFQKLFFYK